MEVARVFPRRTTATPDDPLAFVGAPPLLFPPAVDRVDVSVAFSWDLPIAERLAVAWGRLAPVSIGGPATGEAGGEFTPGKYLRHGYVITSRGCPNRCWFCSVWRREGGEVRELPVADGWNVLDDNLLACSEGHVRAVFAMLKRQPHRAQFTGGLEAKRLLPWHVDLLASLRPASMFFAYDTPDDWEPLVAAASMLREAGFDRHQLRAYVLIGGPGDTIDAAEARLQNTVGMGIYPMAMLWRPEDGRGQPLTWRRFQRTWARPAIIYAKRPATPGKE